MNLIIPDTIIKSFLGYDVVNKDFMQWRDVHFIKERIRNNIAIKVISIHTAVSDDYVAIEKKQLRESRYLQKSDQELGCGRFIYDNNKCMLIMYDSSDISGMIIESQSIYNLSSLVFDNMWLLLGTK